MPNQRQRPHPVHPRRPSLPRPVGRLSSRLPAAADAAGGHGHGRTLPHLWYPLYAFIRRRGHPAYDAEDLTQEFFARLLDKHFLAAADREKGRFRTFLLMAVKRFLANEHDAAQARRRGGGRPTVSLDGMQPEPAIAWSRPKLTPERLFEQQWALALLEHVLARLRPK